MGNKIKYYLSIVLAFVMVFSNSVMALANTETNVGMELNLPTATVTELQNEELTFALNFKADEVTDEQLALYGGWYADFVLTVNKNVTFNADGSADGYLSGQYDAWSENWVNVPFEDVILGAGTSLKIMEYAAELMGEPGLKYTYKEVYEAVKDFDCGVYFSTDFLLANPDLEVTLELRMYNPENEAQSYAIGDIYVFTCPMARNVRTQKVYNDISEALIDAAEDDTVLLLKDTTMSIVSVPEKVTLDLSGNDLEATYITCFGDIVDSSEDNDGVLKVDSKRFMIRQDNEQLPVKSEGGYRFFEAKLIQQKYAESLSKYGFQMNFDEELRTKLLEGKATTGVTVNVKVSWAQDNGLRSQIFEYNDEMVTQYINSYNETADKYTGMFALTLTGTDGFKNLAFEAIVKSDTGVEIQSGTIKVETESESGNVTTNDANEVVDEVQIDNTQASAVVAAGTKLAENTTQLTLTAEEMDATTSNITVGEGEQMLSLNVHVEGVAEDNTVPVIITLNEIAPESLNQGNISLYHVENGTTVAMTRVNDLAEVDAHNEFYYDITTGTITMAMATFSEVAVVADTVNAWNGDIDTTWYNTTDTEFEIYNADQLAGFGQIVGGMAADIERDSFANKTVKLVSDINLGDKDNANADLIFYPIGYYNNQNTYDRGSVTDTVESGVYSFEGIFDGNGHTISYFYQNTWEMLGDYNNGYDGTPNYYKDAMGLFGYVKGGEVRNLTVDNFSSDGEFTPTGVIAAYAVNSTFENIAITNCNPRVYNTGNGGIIGIAGRENDAVEALVLKNITVDNSNKISALWGSWDVACGGLVGMYRGNVDGNGEATGDTIDFENCHVAAQIDVYNDVCANYQYYAYRYAGMIIGSIRHNTTDEAGKTIPNMAGITATGCTVNYGTWNDYYYCEFEKNSIASYSEDYQFSRVPHSELNFTDSNGNGIIDTVGERNSVTGCKHNHTAEEDKKAVYLPFHQLFTGYSWGVSSIGLKKYSGIVTDLDITEGDDNESVVKFESVAEASYTTGTTVTIGDLFAEIENVKPAIDTNNVQVTVSPVDKDSTAGGTYTANTGDWTKGTLEFSGVGVATITITDYYFCTPTTIKVTVKEPESVDKFALVFENTDDYLYRVGNQNAVALGNLFKAVVDSTEIGNVTVDVEALNGASVSGTYTANASDWTKGTIQFANTGVVKVTITDNDYCNPTELYLEVVDAKNATTAASATANNVVLLNDISGTFTVSNGYTFYGNGFTVTLPTTSVQKKGNGFTGYISIGASQDDGIASGGNLDNVRIEGPVYPEMYIYRDQAEITDKNDDDYDAVEPNMRYFKNSVIIYGGNCTISNSYISGSRTALCLRGGNNVVIENTTLAGGSYANMQICAGSNVTLRDLTTVQVDVADSYGKGKTAHGLGIAVDSSVVDIYIEGELNQYNWLCKTQWDSIVPSSYQSSFPNFFENDKYSGYWHCLNDDEGSSYVNLTFVYACNWDISKIHDDRTTVDYATCDSTIAGVAGGVYSKVNTVGGNAITATNLEDPGYASSGFNPVAPVLNFDNTANADEDDVNDAADTYCVYDEASGTLKIGITEDSKVIDLSGVSVTKNGADLTHTAYLNGNQISGSSVTIYAADGAKQMLTFKATSSDAGYDKDGNPIEGNIEYTWTVTIEVATLAYPAPVWNMGGDYQFDTLNCVYAYYKASQGYGEAVPIYDGIKVNYYNKSGTLVELDLSSTNTLPTGSNNSNSNAFTYTLIDGSTLTMKFSSGWKSGATTHQFTTYNDKVYIYPQSLDNDNYVRAKTTNQDFDVKITYEFTDPNGQSTGDQTMRWYNAKENNGSVSKVQWKSFDSTNGKEECVTPDTLITLADGSKVRVDSLTGNEELLVWNLQTGQYDTATMVFVDTEMETEYEIIHMYFSDGSDVKVISEHGFFDLDLGKYVYIDALNYADYVGHRFVAEGSISTNSWSEVTLDKVVIEREVTTAWSPVTFEHLCYYTNGVLSMPGGIDGLFNIFEVDTDTMRYDAEQKQNDIEKYGLFTLEDFGGLITEEAFEAFNGAYLKVAIGKGMITWEDIAYLAERYIPLMN